MINRVDRAGHRVTPASPRRHLLVFAAFVVGYFLLGMAGLQLQSAQAGVTPVWPASGLALAMVYWFGLGHVIAILPAMLALAWTLGLPLEVAVPSAAGSMLEAALPAYLLRRLGVDPGLRHLRDAMLFVALGPVLGPVFSATAGSFAFHLLGDSSFDPLRLWLLWWLGNSIGLLLFGGLGLVAVARRSLRLQGGELVALLFAAVVAIVITALGLLQVMNVSSTLVLYLLIPVFVLIALRGDQLPVLLLGTLVMGVVVLSAAWLPPEILAQDHLGILYLDVSLLWVVTFTGMIVSSARQEMQAREQVAWLAEHDPLTRLFNRHAFMKQLEQVMAQPVEAGPGNVLLFLDLDRFKALNDAEGHRAGDQVLRDVGALLVEQVRSADTVARLGGDEFAMILRDCRPADACVIAENIRRVIEDYVYRGREGTHQVEGSIGVLVLGEEQSSPEGALHAVDSACYQAKRAGRNRVEVYKAEMAGALA